MLTFETTDALSAPTLAATRANGNFEANKKALADRQPNISIAPLQNITEFLFGRDGSLTARDTEGRWISRSSLPTRVAQDVLKKLELTGTVACLLAPTHAAQIRVALSRIGSHRAIVAIVPSASELTHFLHCDDFAADINANRLWFTAGENWIHELGQIFTQHMGLPSPSQFIKLPLVAGELNDALIAGAQSVFAEIQNARHQQARLFQWNPSRNTAIRTIGVVAPGQFRLWNDAGHALSQVFKSDTSPDLRIIHIDPDDPASAEPLDLPRHVANCDAIVTVETTRADLPNLLSINLPWISWMTTPRVPAIESMGLHDHLIVADPAIAHTAGWPSHRVHRAGWPTIVHAADQTSPQALALIADTFSLDTPNDLNDFSSHRVLWDTLRAEIRANPFIVGTDPHKYLLNRVKQVGFNPDQFPVLRFVTQLVYPAIAQSIASILIGAKLPVKLHGGGWESIEEFAPSSAGTITNRHQFEEILNQPIALIDVWPGLATHPIRSTGKLFLPFNGQSRETYARNAQKLLSGQSVPSMQATPTLSLRLFREILSAIPA